MNKLSQKEVNSVITYIGGQGGYLGNFSYRTHAEFYPLYCGLDINPNEYEGTTRQRFIEILSIANGYEQAKILKGILEKYPIERYEELHEEEFISTIELSNKKRLFINIKNWINELEGKGLIKVDELKYNYQFVDDVLNQAELLIHNHSAASAIDRTHTALHGYLKRICNEAGINFEATKPKIQDIFSKLKTEHPCFKIDIQEHYKPINQIINSLCKVLDNCNEIRNNRTYTHPNEEILEEQESLFIINISRAILNYVNSKIEL
jgi:hypothetical protein